MNRRTWLGTVVLAAFLALAAGPAGAGTMPNGLMPNGLMPNGLMPNGLMPNGLMPNGLMPNGLMPNGLMPNGLMPNGLMPNGLLANGLMPNGLTSYAIYGGMYASNGTTSTSFDQWFATDPATRDNFMKYFARCAYDGTMEVTYVDPSKKSWRWSGGIGFAMTSLKAGVQMTVDESKWISSCLLAFINTQGTHQYLSLRASPPNVEAQQALTLSTGELWTMNEFHGVFFGDLFAETPRKHACFQTVADPEGLATISLVLGRTCDESIDCEYIDEAGTKQAILEHLLSCSYPTGGGEFSDIVNDPWYRAPTFTHASVDYRPVFVNGPRTVVFKPGAPGSPANPGYLSIGVPATSLPFAPSQLAECLGLHTCLGRQFPQLNTPGYDFSDGEKLVGLVAGQMFDVVSHYPDYEGSGQQSWAHLSGAAMWPAEPDMTEAFTAIVRYSNPRASPGAARVQVSDMDGTWRDAGTEVWPSTGDRSQYEWLQVYPVYPFRDTVDAAGKPAIRIRFSGAEQGDHCSGTKLKKGDGETGACNLNQVYFDWRHLKVACRESGESQPICRGELILDYRNRRWGWFCAYGGPPVFACSASDAPDLNGSAFVPGKPWCAPAGATSFIGVCK